MNAPGVGQNCENCGRVFAEDDLDPFGWCPDCRREVIRRATWVARAVAILAALLVIAAIVVLIRPSVRFTVAWMLLVVLVYFVVFKTSQRVGFEMIRGRGVPHRRQRK